MSKVRFEEAELNICLLYTSQECLGYIVRPFTISLPMKILSLSRLAGISELPKRALKNGITCLLYTSGRWQRVLRIGHDLLPLFLILQLHKFKNTEERKCITTWLKAEMCIRDSPCSCSLPTRWHTAGGLL